MKKDKIELRSFYVSRQLESPIRRSMKENIEYWLFYLFLLIQDKQILGLESKTTYFKSPYFFESKKK